MQLPMSCLIVITLFIIITILSFFIIIVFNIYYYNYDYSTFIERIQSGIGFIDSPTQTFRIVYIRKIYEKLNCVC